MYTQIDAWLDRRFSLPYTFTARADALPANYWLAFLMIEEEVPLHQIQSVSWKSISHASEEVHEYVRRAIEINGSDQIEEIDDKKRIVEILGYPPRVAVPIYLIVIRSSTTSSVVYVGKTTTANRFASGHAVAMKLHDARFAGFEKFVYRCSVTISMGETVHPEGPQSAHDQEWILLEWVYPAKVAESILDDIESHLIFGLRPECNIYKKKKLVAKHKDVTIHIQHRLDQNSFLHDYTTR